MNDENFYNKKINPNCEISAIIGIAKNSGKTTFLNYYLRKSRKKFAIFTTGRDGEEFDLIEKIKKPKVMISAKSFFICSTSEIKKHFSKIIIHKKLDFASIKELYIVQALDQIEAEIMGPSLSNEQVELAQILTNFVDEVIIDGSLDRKSIALFSEINNIYLVGGASFGNIEDTYLEFYRLFLLQNFGESKTNYTQNFIYWENGEKVITDICSVFGNENEIANLISKKCSCIFIPGALTDYNFIKLRSFLKGKKVIFNHPLNVFLNNKNLKILLKNSSVFAQKRFDVKKIGINSYSPNGLHFNTKELQIRLQQIFKLEIIDVFSPI